MSDVSDQRLWSRRQVIETLAATLALAACGRSGAAAGPVIVDGGGSDAAGTLADAGASVDGALADVALPDAATVVGDTTATDAVATDAGTAIDAATDDVITDTGFTPLPTAQEALTPVTANDYYFVTSCCGTPNVDGATWQIEVRDRGVPIGALDLAFLDSLPAVLHEHTLECISASSAAQKISNAIWTGAPLTAVLQAAQISLPQGVDSILCSGADGYKTSVHVADLSRPIWLVWRMNGVPLPAAHGFPARLLVPGRYGMKSPKWLTSLDFIEGSKLNY